MNLITLDELAALEELTTLRNLVAHRADHAISRRQALECAGLTRQILRKVLPPAATGARHITPD